MNQKKVSRGVSLTGFLPVCWLRDRGKIWGLFYIENDILPSIPKRSFLFVPKPLIPAEEESQRQSVLLLLGYTNSYK